MWTPLKNDVTERFDAVELFFKSTRRKNYKFVRGNAKFIEQTAKGLAFVHLYSAYEYAVKAIVRTAVDSIIAHRHKPEDLSPPLLALFLDPLLRSLRDVQETEKIWPARIRVFERLFSTYPANVPNTVFPNDGSHFRKDQLETVFRVLGIKRLPARRKSHLRIINELVHNRNSVAHGQETAAEVGGRYTRTEVIEKMGKVKSVCLFMASVIETQCSDRARHCRKSKISISKLRQ